MLLLMSLLLFQETPPKVDWQTGPWGDTAFIAMEHAPFPHASRAQGFQHKGTTYPADKHYSDNTVAVFIPRSYQPAASGVNLLIYLHGHRNNVRNVLKKFDLRRQVALSKQPVILVVPQGPLDVPDSSAGKLAEPGGLYRLTEELLNRLATAKKVPQPRPGTLVLAGHSGAYRGLAAMLHQGGVPAVQHVILLDATYGQLATFAAWASADKRHRLASIFTDHLQQQNWQLLALLDQYGANYRIGSTATHDPNELTPEHWFIRAEDLGHDDTVNWLQYFLNQAQLGDEKP